MSDNSMSTSSPQKVTFSQYSQLAFVPRDDAESKWFSSQEKRSNREELIQDTRHMMKEINSTPPNSITAEQLCNCIGIEVFVTQGLAAHVEKGKRTHVQAVLAAQRLQRQQGIYNADMLCDVAKKTSRSSRNRAWKLAVGYGRMVQR